MQTKVIYRDNTTRVVAVFWHGCFAYTETVIFDPKKNTRKEVIVFSDGSIEQKIEDRG